MTMMIIVMMVVRVPARTCNSVTVRSTLTESSTLPAPGAHSGNQQWGTGLGWVDSTTPMGLLPSCCWKDRASEPLPIGRMLDQSDFTGRVGGA